MIQDNILNPNESKNQPIQKPQLNINLKNAVDITCSDTLCGNNIFRPAYYIKKVSSMETGTGKPGVIPVQIFVCSKCGEPLDEETILKK